MAKDMELLQKMELTDEARTKLTALLEESKKTKKIASKKLVDALDAVDATEEQTEQFYDVLEAALRTFLERHTKGEDGHDKPA